MVTLSLGSLETRGGLVCSRVKHRCWEGYRDAHLAGTATSSRPDVFSLRAGAGTAGSTSGGSTAAGRGRGGQQLRKSPVGWSELSAAGSLGSVHAQVVLSSNKPWFLEALLRAAGLSLSVAAAVVQAGNVSGPHYVTLWCTTR